MALVLGFGLLGFGLLGFGLLGFAVAFGLGLAELELLGLGPIVVVADGLTGADAGLLAGGLSVVVGTAAVLDGVGSGGGVTTGSSLMRLAISLRVLSSNPKMTPTVTAARNVRTRARTTRRSITCDRRRTRATQRAFRFGERSLTVQYARRAEVSVESSPERTDLG